MSDKTKAILGMTILIVVCILGVYCGVMTIVSVINRDFSRATFDLILFSGIDYYIYEVVSRTMDTLKEKEHEKEEI